MRALIVLALIITFNQMTSQNKSYKIELDKLYSSQNFKEEKTYFQFGNYDYRFKFINDNERKNYDLSNSDEYLVAISLSYDLDDHFHLVYNEKQEAYYIRNGASSSTSQSVGGNKRLLKPIKIGKSLIEIFGNEKFYEILEDLNNHEYNLFCEIQFHGGEETMNGPIPSAFIPNEDLRLYVQKTCSNCYLTSHEEYNTKKFTDFLSKKSIDKYFNVDTFFSKRLHPKDFIEVLNKINQDIGRKRFLFIEFFPSGWYAIIDTDDLTKYDFLNYLKLGLIYNKIDIPEEIYEQLK